MKANPIANAIKDVFKGGGVQPSESQNTHVTLSSQADPTPEPRPDHGERDGNGTLPELMAFKGDRARVLKDIAARSNAQADENASERIPATDEDGNEAETNPTQEAADGPDLDAEPQEQKPDAGATTVAAQPAPAAPAAEETRTLIVDGKEMQVPLSKIVEMGTRTLQKEVAADLRLSQATQMLEEARRIASQPAPQVQAPASPLEGKSAEEIADLIQFGTKEQAAEAVKYLMKPAAPAIQPEEIVKVVQQAVGPQMSFEAAKSFVESEYGDLLSDPDYRAIFLSKENALRKAGDQRGYVDLYKAIGDEMRTKFNRPKPGAQAPAAQAQPSTNGRTMEEKRAAKAQAPAAPRLASARLDGDGQQPRPPTRGEVIDKMRKARAFQPYAAQK